MGAAAAEEATVAEGTVAASAAGAAGAHQEVAIAAVTGDEEGASRRTEVNADADTVTSGLKGLAGVWARPG